MVTRRSIETGENSECRTAETFDSYTKRELSSFADLPSHCSLMLVVDSVTSVNLGFNRLITLPADVGLFLKLQELDLR